MKTAVAEIVIIAFHIITLCIHESFGDGGGLAELAAITGDVPYFDSGNPWITYPRIADGGGRFYKPYYYDRVSPYYTSDLSLPYYYSLRGFSRRSPERLGSRTIFYGGKRDSLINTILTSSSSSNAGPKSSKGSGFFTGELNKFINQ